MKSRNITTIIAEGTDGVGKSALIDELFKIYNYRYMVYHRGELSNLFYAMKYNRPFSVTQNGLPFLHILLTCEKSELRQRIIKRGFEKKQSWEEVQSELMKVNDQDEFIRLFNSMKNDYHMIMIDTTNLTIEQVGKKVAKEIDEYVSKLENDEEISSWNKMYEKACKKLGLRFSTKDNQPYINDVPFMSELTNQQGVYERFDNRIYPDNLIYSMSYEVDDREIKSIQKSFDFSYVINSKILRRPEIFDYYRTFEKNGKSCIIGDNKYVRQSEYLRPINRVFGDDFIKENAKAKATVYCARDLAHLKMQTARLYEAILARQVVFVDKDSDKDGDILRSIWGYESPALQQTLSVTPETIIDRYHFIFSDAHLVEYILEHQLNWYKALIENVGGGKF